MNCMLQSIHTLTLPCYLVSSLAAITDTEWDNDMLLMNKATSPDAIAAASAQRSVHLQDALVLLDDLPTEKRSAVRQSTWKKVFFALTLCATGSQGQEAVNDSIDALRTAALYSLRVGQPAEQYAACRVLQVASILLGDNQEDWVRSIEETLRRIVMTTSRPTMVRAAALAAWSMAVFINVSDTAEAEGLMDLCEQVAQDQYRNQETPLALRATALDAWALQATTIDDFYLSGQDDSQIGRGVALLELLKDCLEVSSVDVRSAAGQALSLIHESRLHLGVGEDETENATERRYAQGTWEGSDQEVIMDEVKQRIAELAVESGKHLSKKTKKEQRATFREYQATLVDDESPDEDLNVRNCDLTLTSWRAIIQMNNVRQALQGGFQIQLMTNATLQSIFGVDGSLTSGPNTNMSSIEKRLFLSKGSEASKMAYQDMRKKREKRQNVKNHFFTVDGDDI
jgi:Interferon-related developmental regulator (IFRD)